MVSTPLDVTSLPAYIQHTVYIHLILFAPSSYYAHLVLSFYRKHASTCMYKLLIQTTDKSKFILSVRKHAKLPAYIYHSFFIPPSTSEICLSNLAPFMHEVLIQQS